MIPAMLQNEYEKICLRPNWVIESAECIKDAIKHLMEVKLLVEDGLNCPVKEIRINGDKGVFHKNTANIVRSLRAALLDIAIFSDQFKRIKENKKEPEKSDVLIRLEWADLDCKSIDDDSLIKLAKYMRNYFSHVRTSKQSFAVIASMEADPEKSCRGDWTMSKYYKIDIQRMVANHDIRPPHKSICINDFTDLLTEQKYTDLTGRSTGRAYVDVGKFANEMILRLRSIWECFVSQNSHKWDDLRKSLQVSEVLQGKLREVDYALDASNLVKLGWYNINGEYSPSKYEVSTNDNKIHHKIQPNNRCGRCCSHIRQTKRKQYKLLQLKRTNRMAKKSKRGAKYATLS